MRLWVLLGLGSFRIKADWALGLLGSKGCEGPGYVTAGCLKAVFRGKADLKKIHTVGHRLFW